LIPKEGTKEGIMATTISEQLVSELDMASGKLKGQQEPSDGSLKIIYSEAGPEAPIAGIANVAEAIKVYSGDYYGACSLEKFHSAGGLSYTHEDAGGWLDYVTKFNQYNFWYKDGNVGIWMYYEDYDNWQDTYGADAVMAFYHSGHGGMGGDGTFYVPMGNNWGGQDTAVSSNMCLGNEQVRYIFWSTCLSCRVLDGHSPMRTWNKPNCGFRMLFGFETTSIDHDGYGKWFWEEWNKNKSFSQAWLDASWRISHHQAPSVTAVGATADEAKNRVFNERYFYWDTVSRNWWWWRWYSAAATATGVRSLNQSLPGNLLVARLEPRIVDGQFVQRVLAQHNLGIGLPREVIAGPGGIFTLKEGDRAIAFEADGSYEIQFSRPNVENTNQIPMQKAISKAEDFVQQQGLREDLIFDRVRLACEAGGSDVGSGERQGPYITETTVQFTQRINGLPVILPGKGGVTVSIDNDGNVTRLSNSTRAIETLSDKFKSSVVAPEEKTPLAAGLDPEARIYSVWQERLKSWIIRDTMPRQWTPVPGTYEIGYAIKGNEAILVARQEFEVDFGGGYFKRYVVEVPLVE
jgi:hypothetical protein